MENIRVELIEAKHLNGLCKLYKEIFNRNVKPQYFEIKYGLKLPDVTVFSQVLLVDDLIVGFMGAIFQSFESGNDEIRTLSLGDFFLIEKYRGKGTFNVLYEALYEAAMAKNITTLYAFQSQQTYKVCKKWGWKDGNHFVRFHIKGISPFFSKILRKLAPLVQQQRLKKALKDYQISFNKALHVRDSFQNGYHASFFKMKANNTLFWIEIENVILCLKFDVYVTVGYIYTQEHSNIEEMLKIIKRILKKSWIHDMVFHIQAQTQEAKQMEKVLKKEPSFLVSSYQLQEQTLDFNKVRLNFMDMDVF